MSSEKKHSFFRQSGWMVMATFTGGIFMAGVQALAGQMRDTDCNNFVALLGLSVVFGGVPAAALQTIFAQQAAAAMTEEKIGLLTATVRALLRSIFIGWLVVAGLALIFTGPLAAALGVKDPAALRIMLLCILSLIWGPVFKGVLQGEHRFAPLGWLLILEGVVRIGTFILLVLVLKGGAAAGVWAVFAGQYLVLAIGIGLTWKVWSAKTPIAFSWKAWLKRGAPLTMGLGAYVSLTRLDNLFVNSLFAAKMYQSEVKLYMCAMFIGFAITQFIAPITAVMFPTIVRNLALSKKSNAVVVTLGVTAAFACLAAVGCTLLPTLPLRILHYNVAAAPLVPWFAWAVLPLTLAYVLIQNLLAQERYAAAPWLIAVPVSYGLALMAQAHQLLGMPVFAAFERVILTLGLFSLLLCVVAAWFTWRNSPSKTE
jgi:O-antigen/teichoic acid export membrane protein